MDISAVDFLSSIGIRTLLLSAKAISQRNGKMALLNPNAAITNVLQMAGIDTLIPVCSSLDKACEIVTS